MITHVLLTFALQTNQEPESDVPVNEPQQAETSAQDNFTTNPAPLRTGLLAL